MTWGQIRLQLQTSAPGVSLDLIDEYLNTRYGQVLGKTDWQGLHYHATIQTTAAYQSASDTVTFTVGSTSVTGSGTTWTSAITGMKIYRPGDSVVYTVTYVGATALTLDRAYEGNGIDATGTVYAGSKYVFMQNVYQLPNDVRAVVTILDPVSGYPLDAFSKDGLDRSAGPRTLVNDPTSYAPIDDTNENNLPVYKQVELFPPPLRARGFPLEYLHAAVGFNGANTSGAPLPFVTDQVLLYGCRADIAAYLAAQQDSPAKASPFLAQSKLYEAKFQEQIADMLRIEHQQRRPKVKVRMATRFTRHRMARAARGLNNSWGPGQGGPN